MFSEMLVVYVQKVFCLRRQGTKGFKMRSKGSSVCYLSLGGGAVLVTPAPGNDIELIACIAGVIVAAIAWTIMIANVVQLVSRVTCAARGTSPHTAHPKVRATLQSLE